MNLQRILAIIAVLIVSALLFIHSTAREPHTRLLLFFDHVQTDGEMCEVRYLWETPNRREARVVDELLLGPINHNYMPLFVGTPQVLRCFTQNKTLYIDLPESGFNVTGTQKATMPKRAFTLLKKNIFENCPDIDRLCVYLDGKQIYSDTSSERNTASK